MSRTYRNRHNRGNCWYLNPSLVMDNWYNKQISKVHRDGYLSDNGRCRYKEYSDKRRRLNERSYLIKIKKYDLDHIPYPCEKELKYLAWIVW